MTLFAAYSAAIYAFAVDLGPLFLVWVTTLGVSLRAVWSALPQLTTRPARRVPRWAGGTLAGVGVAFLLVWLSQIAAALARGGSSSMDHLGLPTNPVHVLDLAILIPAVVIVGLRTARTGLAGWALPSLLGLLVLMCLPILATPMVQLARHEPSDPILMLPFSGLFVVLLVALWRTLPRREAHRDVRPC